MRLHKKGPIIASTSHFVSTLMTNTLWDRLVPLPRSVPHNALPLEGLPLHRVTNWAVVTLPKVLPAPGVSATTNGHAEACHPGLGAPISLEP